MRPQRATNAPSERERESPRFLLITTCQPSSFGDAAAGKEFEVDAQRRHHLFRVFVSGISVPYRALASLQRRGDDLLQLPAYHVNSFDHEFRISCVSVSPGITAMWQISSRSNP